MQVVVENEKVGSQLLENGKLTKRVTMIPLNQIQAFVASAEVRFGFSLCLAKSDSLRYTQKVATAKQVSKGTADLALSLVGYADDVSKAMEYVFGNVLICPDAASANAVTFHADIRMKSVTLEGDVYDPSGTLSGGSKPSTSGILIKVQELNALEEQLAKVKRALWDAEKEWDSVKDKVKRWKDARRDLDLQKHQVELLDQRVKESNATKVSD
jgi:structural maintenance of chromosome 2